MCILQCDIFADSTNFAVRLTERLPHVDSLSDDTSPLNATHSCRR